MRAHRLVLNPNPDMPGRPFEKDSLIWLANTVRMSRLFTVARQEYLVLRPRRLNWLSWASDWADLARRAWLYEALIEPVCMMFRQSGYCHLPVFELRETTRSSVIQSSPDDSVETIWGRSSSAWILDGVVTALCSGDDVLAAKIASLATDQPVESCAVPSSKSRRPNEFFLVFALRALFCGDVDEAVELLGKVKWTPSRFTECGLQSRLLRAIAKSDPDTFVCGLVDLLEWFEPWAVHRSRRLSSESYGCWPAAAWSVLAFRMGIVTIDDLPDSSPYFPLDLVRGAARFDPRVHRFEFHEFTVDDFGYRLTEMSDEWLIASGLARDGSDVPRMDPPAADV